MRNGRTISILVILLITAAFIATITGIMSEGGPGESEFTSIHGQTVKIYGTGLYRHMSSEVAPQGIAQDYVTLFIAIPMLLISLLMSLKGSVRARFVLSGTLGYFLVTYLFYLAMAAYNEFFLIYTFLLGASFFAFSLSLLSFKIDALSGIFQNAPSRLAGGFLLINAALINMLWLSIIVPPLIDKSLYPESLEHYTTLIVQGMDLGLLLPLAVVSGILLMKKKPFGYLLGPVYLIFLSLLMIALIAKLIMMGLRGSNIIPAIYIIPVIALASAILSILLLKSITTKK